MSTYNEDKLQQKIDELLRERGVMESLVHDLQHQVNDWKEKYGHLRNLKRELERLRGLAQ